MTAEDSGPADRVGAPPSPGSAGNDLESPRPGRAALNFVLRNPIVPILALALPLFSLFVPGYATLGNLGNLLLQSSVLLLLAAGAAIVVISGNFDLSVEGTLAFTAVFAGWLMYTEAPGSGWGIHPVVALTASLLVGAGVGAANGYLVEGLHINPFIVTLGTLLTLKGAAAIPTQANTLFGLPDLYSLVGQTSLLGVSPIVLLAVTLYVIVALMMRYSVASRHVYAVGGAKKAARENGINPLRVIMGAYVVSGVLAATAGWLTSARLDSSGPLLGDQITFTVFAAIVIGGIALEGGKGSLWGALGGVALLGSIDNVLNLLAVNPLFVNFVRGSVILVAVLMLVLRGRAARRFGVMERAA